jgi:hypothetical protein
VLGHVFMVLGVPKNRGILAGMLRGRVPREVAERSAPRWLAAVESDEEARARAAGE